MGPIFEAIEKRYSVRNYSGREIEKDKLRKIRDYIDENKRGPFGSDVRFVIINATDYDQAGLKELGTYGMINGPRIFIAGTVKSGKKAMEDFGYCMEKNILAATELGLGTCWLGGSFSRSTFARKINAEADELVPAITPLGYSGDKRTFKENLIRMAVGARNRKKPEELFFDGSIETPLDLNSCGQYSKVLAAVRLAPSASNKQPWRIIRDRGNAFHFFMKEDRVYNNILKDIRIQNVDMGIAICHFELTANELGLTGNWEAKEPAPAAGDLKYIASWISAG